jgi:hypothetical protein
MENQQEKKALRPLKAEAGWTVDPLSDLVSASELRAWRGDATTEKVMRYLARFREQLVESIADGSTVAATSEATATLTTEAVAHATLLKDLLTLEAKDLARFYGQDEPKERA